MKINEVVYYCLDAIKAFSDDASVNEEHVLFLLSKYRGALLQQYHNIKKEIPESNYQTICIDLEDTTKIHCMSGPERRSVQEIPNFMTIGSPSVLLYNGFESEVIEFVPYKRLKSVGHNKWKENFIYAAMGPDQHLYLSSTNPQYLYLEKVKVRGIFEDFEKAAELDCNYNAECSDIMELEFPLEVSLVPDLIARVVKDILGTAWRMADGQNNATDDLSDIATFVRRTMKSQFARQIEGDE